MFLASALWRHAKDCKLKPCGSSEKDHQRQDKALLPILKSVLEPYKKDILDSLQADKQADISHVVKNDPLVNQFGQRLYIRCRKHAHLHQYVKQKLRELGRFLICARENRSIHTLQDCISPGHFNIVCEAVRSVCQFQHEEGSFKIPSLSLKLGHSLAKCARIVRSNAQKAGDADLKKEAEGFLDLYRDDWNDEVSCTALQDLPVARYKVMRLPLAKDLQKLPACLQQKANEALACTLVFYDMFVIMVYVVFVTWG
jgi:hypothetical protein